MTYVSNVIAHSRKRLKKSMVAEQPSEAYNTSRIFLATVDGADTPNPEKDGTYSSSGLRSDASPIRVVLCYSNIGDAAIMLHCIFKSSMVYCGNIQ